MPSSLASQLIHFYKTLQLPAGLPEGVDVLFPQSGKEVMQVVKTFFHKYYNDNQPRRLLFGINPGRFGGGITGINFTGPRQLTNNCGSFTPLATAANSPPNSFMK